ncbi:MAG TPA: hypothetical protein VJ813_05990 [Vicinamibacterales bacterium]|nr:hypothetical protein [Vicinamibacterales bacterium]
MADVNRRRFLTIIPAVACIPTPGASQAAQVPAVFPRQDPARAREIVGVSHGNLARVKELVSASPALARASWEWGYGDWETALGAASHVGHKEIAAVLLAAGAHPTIFSAAMLGHLETVRAFVSATPGIQKTRGPHGITLLDHARAGESGEVVKYLESVGDAEPRYPGEPLSEQDVAGLLGTYAFGGAATDRLIVSRNSRGALVVKREGEPDRSLFHHGGRLFNPAGAEAVLIRFEPATGPATTITVTDGPLRVQAIRQ